MIHAKDLSKAPKHGWEAMLEATDSEVRRYNRLGKDSGLVMCFTKQTAENLAIWQKKVVEAGYQVIKLTPRIMGTDEFEVNWSCQD